MVKENALRSTVALRMDLHQEIKERMRGLAALVLKVVWWYLPSLTN